MLNQGFNITYNKSYLICILGSVNAVITSSAQQSAGPSTAFPATTTSAQTSKHSLSANLGDMFGYD